MNVSHIVHALFTLSSPSLKYFPESPAIQSLHSPLGVPLHLNLLVRSVTTPGSSPSRVISPTATTHFSPSYYESKGYVPARETCFHSP